MMSFDAVLIANRGEIARRVIRTCRALGLRAVAVHSEADADAPHVREADDAVAIGPAPAAESYLDAERIIEAARATGAGAIHPGYGFLSENADFAEAVEAAGLTFIGPPGSAIRAMGDKAAAKRAMIAAGVPVAPGYEGGDQSDEALVEAAERVGFPLMVKAAAGGGGKGMRLVAGAADLLAAIAEARAEARSSFGDGALILERAILDARHVEIQIFADAHGACLHLGERDCSVQRRHQKVLEEAPCPAVTPALRDAMGAAAVAAARAVDYRGAGTVEFLLDAKGDFYFLEMNTRLQVEHPVTEEVTGLDLVALQIAVAAGEPLPFAQGDLRIEGHAIEARLYAEDAAAGFLPSTGRVEIWRPSPLVRVDDGIAEGGEVTPHYDPMIAKLIARGPTREAARLKLIRALEDTAVAGPKTNRAFLIDVLAHPVFAAGEATTGFLDGGAVESRAGCAPPAEALAVAAALALTADRDAAYAAAGLVGCDQLGWRSDGAGAVPISLVFEGERLDAAATPIAAGWRVRAGEDEVE
ncbi:MAG: biotin carboxylase N-terminal domain-containing protein, partial [Pseudomonadota bacterium]